MNLRHLARSLGACSLLGASLVGNGCSLPSDAAGPAEPEQTGPPSALASVSVAGVKVGFYAVPGPAGAPVIAMSEEGSAYAKRFVVAPLIAQSLTAQEIYLALAGPGATPPRELVDAQAGEAAALGRDAVVRTATIDSHAIVEKDLQACQNFLFAGDLSSWVGNSTWAAGPSSGGSTCAQEIDFDTSAPVGIGACNDGSSALTLNQVIYPDPGWNLGSTFQAFATNINPGWYYAWYWWYSTPGSCTQQGNSCVGSCLSGTPGGLGCPAVPAGALYDAYFTSCGQSDLVSGIWTPNSAPPPR